MQQILSAGLPQHLNTSFISPKPIIPTINHHLNMSNSEITRDAATVQEEIKSSGEFTLRVVSPSVGVSGPLLFPQLSTGTTVKQLKEKIRESLPRRPLDDHQRLIHRGRLLAREDETMLDIFGQDMLKASESQTLHLVLKSVTSDSSPAQNSASLTRQQGHPPVREPLQPFTRPPVPQIPEALLQLAEERRQQRVPNHPSIETARDIRIPTPPHFHLPPTPQPIRFPNPQAVPNLEEHHDHQQPNLMETMRMLQEAPQETARLLQQQAHGSPGVNPFLRERLQSQPIAGMPSFQEIIAQHQRDRAALGMQGAQLGGAQQGGTGLIPNAGQVMQSQVNNVMSQPQINTRTSTQEVTSPNGQRWTVTLNETTTVVNTIGPSVQASAIPEAAPRRDAQDIIQDLVRVVESNANAQRPGQYHDEMNLPHQLASSTSANAGTNQPANAPPQDTFNPTSARLPTNNGGATEPLVLSADGLSNSSILNGPIVYILSSPTGPRALLVNPSENGLDAFYTPRRLSPANTLRQNQQLQNPAQVRFGDAALGLPEVRNRPEGRPGQAHRHGHRHVEAVARGAPGAGHPANPPAGVVAAQMWPHVWLVVRLLGFVWFFTSGSNSWWRFFMFSAVAFIIFIASTGIFNGIAEQVWGPVRRHLENLLPLAAPNGPAQAVPANNPAAAPNAAPGAAAEGLAGAPPGAPGVEITPPDPAQAAARLVEQRMVANENWFWTQFRRAEHATILFLASLVPGVGERHIAARVAEENILLEAQRQRREAEAAAAEEQARAAEGEQETPGDSASLSREGAIASIQGQNENGTGVGNNGAGEAPAQPLIDV